MGRSSRMPLGQQIQHFTVISFSHKNSGNHKYFNCRCVCGTIKVLLIEAIISGNTKSCGCLKNKLGGDAHRKHGLARDRIYEIWSGMKSRCTNPSKKNYKHYGARGISVCKEWSESLEVFNLWAISNGYNETLSIDRIDGNGNYEPSNCRWATSATQNNNRRGNHKITYNGKTQNIGQWHKELNLGITESTFYWRVFNWTIERAFTTPNTKSL